MRLTDAEVKRLSKMTEADRHWYFTENPKFLDLEAVVKKARFLEQEALIKKNLEEADLLQQVVESAVVLIPAKKYPQAIL